MTPSDDAISLAIIRNALAVFSFHDQTADGNNLVMIKFNMVTRKQLGNFAIELDYYPSSSETSNNGHHLNIYGVSPTNDQAAFIRVSLNFNIQNHNIFHLGKHK